VSARTAAALSVGIGPRLAGAAATVATSAQSSGGDLPVRVGVGLVETDLHSTRRVGLLAVTPSHSSVVLVVVVLDVAVVLLNKHLTHPLSPPPQH